ncbi:MAG: arginine--tRNA ligase [Actinomycetota bacterium]
MVQYQLAALLRRAIEHAQEVGSLPEFEVPAFEMERPARKEHGDWSSGIALVVARQAGRKPRDIADAIVAAAEVIEHDSREHVAKFEVAGPGFINITLTHAWLTDIVREVESAGPDWGRSKLPASERIQVEFVSANPTGPLHLGHGRWAAVGDTLARLLEWTGQDVKREFYVNDFGRQIDLFAASIAVRYLERFGRDAGPIPEGGYRGAYVGELAAEIAAEVGDRYVEAPESDRLAFFREQGYRRMLAHQRATLERFGVVFDVWFSETTLHDEGAVQRIIEVLNELGHVYEQDGARWLRTTDFGDDKDRVLVRSEAFGGIPTYVAPDIAYFLDKLRRGFQRMIYLLGADHHGFARRMCASISALGEDPEHCEFMLGQFVHLTRAGESVKMSKRTGEAVTFDELLEEVGVDAARYLLVRTSIDQTINFDLDLAVSQTQENPVYYVQYAHARICSIMRHAADQGVQTEPVDGVALEELQHESELDLLRKIAELPEAVQVAARLRAPHRMTRFAEELAALFHGFYRDCRVVTEDAALTQARLHLARATQISLHNVLALLGVSAPESM